MVIITLSNYSSDFHDGSIYKIHQKDNEAEILIESSEITEMKGDISLTNKNTIRGALCLEGIKKTSILNKPDLSNAEIMHLKITDHKVSIEILLQDFLFNVTGYLTIEIEAEKIWWENIPDLKVP